MSKGPGRVEKKLFEIFKRNGKQFISTRDLCRKVYPTEQVKKKHRVSVLRALARLSTGSMPQLWRVVQKDQRDDLWFDYDRAWPYPNDPPPNGAPARHKRPQKTRRIYFRGRLYEPPRKR
jgi:hypothetical protein